jgi:hypothetical protein
MTKLKTAAKTCMMVSGMTGLILAQDNLPTSAFPTPSGATASTSAGAVAAPRTGLYTVVTKNNAAADNTVDDYSRRPTLIGNRQYFAGFGGPDMQSGAFSFEGKGLNWFGSMTGGANPNLLRVGVGSGTAWGGGALVAIDHTDVTTAAGETTTSFTGNGVGLFGDVNLGNSDVYGQLGWFTGFPGTLGATPLGFQANTSQTLKPNAGGETSLSNWNVNLLAGWKKDATTEGTHALNLEFGYTFGKNTTDGLTPDLDNSVSTVLLNFFHGYILKSASDYAVFLGDNSGIIWQSDKSDAPSVDGSHFGVSVSPNLAFQKQLGKGFEGFSGASVTASFDYYNDEPATLPFPPVAANDASQYLTGSADVAVGLRWVKDNFALEGSLKETVLQNGPYLIGGNANQGLFLQIGMSLGI